MSTQTILVADPDVPFLQALAIGLRSAGYEVALAQTSAQAAERGTKHAPDLVLLDPALPPLEGRPLADHLRAQPGLGDVPMILMTAGAPERLDAATRAAATGILEKPFDAKALLATVGAALGRRVRAPRTLAG